MKLNKKISKFLVLGMLTNNIYFNSIANSDIPNRYETLEGEYITIDDSTEGNLEEIEIFGNTVQDENDLEDIQSVGDLYVDEDGNPILDSQGREQYKIEIISSNKLPIVDEFNTSKLNKVYNLRYKDVVSFHTYNHTKIGDYIQLHFKIKKLSDSIINKDTIHNNLAYSYLGRTGGYESGHITIDEWNNLGVGECIEKTFIRQLSVNESFRDHLYFGFGLRPRNSLVTDDESYLGDFIIENIDFDIVNSSEYYPLNQDKTTILLPMQLQKIGDVSDRLYWDRLKHRYLIKKNIGVYTTRDFKSSDISYDEVCNNFNLYATGTITKSWPYNYTIKTTIGDFSYHDVNAILIPDTYFEEFKDDIDGLYNHLENINFKAYYVLIDNQVDEVNTSITSKLKIPTYKGKTYVFIETENRVNPKLKVIVDRLPQMAGSAVEEAIIDSTSNNISLARMYVNMLPESLYKDQLQEQLSQVFSSDITLDRESASSNLDVYVKSENMLSISLDTNSVTFEEYSGAEPIEKLNAVNITINSSLPYDLNAYMPIEITNSDGSSIIDFDILNIKESSESTYQQFADITNKVVLKSNCVKGNNINHSIDLKLDSNAAHKADVYKTVIKFEAEQK